MAFNFNSKRADTFVGNRDQILVNAWIYSVEIYLSLIEVGSHNGIAGSNKIRYAAAKTLRVYSFYGSRRENKKGKCGWTYTVCLHQQSWCRQTVQVHKQHRFCRTLPFINFLSAVFCKDIVIPVLSQCKTIAILGSLTTTICMSYPTSSIADVLTQ